MDDWIFGYVGVRYNEAPLSVRERVSFTDSKKMDLLREMQKIGVEQCMILSTCNRSEIFFFCRTDKSVVRRCYEEAFPEADVSEYLLEEQGREALSYLFRVTAGLESLVLGEDQILGQVGEAMDFSRTMGFAGKELNKVVRDAITCAKHIKTELKISEKPLSVSYVGIRKLEEYCGVRGRKALVIGSGKTAMLALTYLYEYGAGQVFACNRTLAHADQLRETFPHLQVVDYERRYDIMKQCDIVVSATASPHLVVKADRFREIMSSREQGERSGILFLDLAAPRDVDTALAEEPGVQIINLDTLQQITADNWKERERLAEESREMIGEAVAETEEWLRISRMDDTIESLQKRCGSIVEDSYEYLNRKLDLSRREQKIVRKVLNASLQRLLKEPIQELKHLGTREEQDEYKKMLQHLFQIESEEV